MLARLTIGAEAGAFLVTGGYVAYVLSPYVGFWGALLRVPPLTGVIGLVVERVLIRPLTGACLNSPRRQCQK